jgi:N-acetylmuramoyl-L-alanine amidase
VRSWSAGDTTRVAVEVSGEFKYKSDRLENPPRLFFDVQDARPVMAQKTIAVGDHLLKQIRIAETQPGTTRIVFDLEQEVEFTASQLSNPERLMVEIRSKGAKVSTSTGADTEGPAHAEPRKFEPPPRQIQQAPTATAKPLPTPPLLTAVSRPVGVAPAADLRRLPGPPATPASTPSTAPSTVRAPEPKGATRNANGERSLTRALGLKLGRVVLDPGHGGHDVGTHGPSGLYEKDLVLDVSQRLAALLQDRLGSEVLLTRSDDT